MSWSDKATEKLVSLYQEGTTVDDLCVEFARNKTSIINKLVKEGVYVKPTKPAVVTKKLLVRRVRAVTGLDLPSMEKMDKNDFIALVNWLECPEWFIEVSKGVSSNNTPSPKQAK